jgi:ABC-type lipopolysaccharide export system ATPase subunit
MSRAIVVEGLVRDFAGTRALDGVNLNVPAGQVLGLLGPNGAGKTTMVRTLATLLAPTAGQAWVGGFDVVREAARVREIIGLTGQYASVDEKLTGRENLILIGRLLGLKRAEAKARADALLADFALEEAGHRLAKTYSGGMRRRLDLAASLVGVMARDPEHVQLFGFTALFPLTFVSSAFVPVETMPEWLQGFVYANPVSLLADAARALMNGGPAAAPALGSLLWALGIALVPHPFRLQ